MKSSDSSACTVIVRDASLVHLLRARTKADVSPAHVSTVQTHSGSVRIADLSQVHPDGACTVSPRWSSHDELLKATLGAETCAGPEAVRSIWILAPYPLADKSVVSTENCVFSAGGSGDGSAVGDAVGVADGSGVGVADGSAVGSTVGSTVGTSVGSSVG